jgi:hypothetical protein
MTEKRKVISGNVEPGDTARCKVTQIEGVVVVRHDYLYGVPRIGIQPPGSHEGKTHESLHMDLPQAELLEKNTVSRDGMIASRAVNLGDKCKDKISGFEGICTGMAVWLYSCTKVMLTPQKMETKTYKPAESNWFDEPQISLVKAKVIKEDSKTTGGFDKSISSSSKSSCSSFKHS